MLKKIMLCLGLLGIAVQASESNKNALWEAIEANDIEKAESVLSSISSDSDRQDLLANADWHNYSALEVAAYLGKKDIFMWLFESFGPTPDQDISSLFNRAAFGGNLDIMEQVYLSVPAENRQELINSTPGYSYSPLITAARRGHPEAVEWLLQHGADINAKYDKSNVLYAAVDGDNFEVLDCLFKHIQDKEKIKDLLTFRTKWGETVLMHGAFRENKDVFERLVEEAKKVGIDPDEYMSTKDHTGENILSSAARRGTLDIVEYLLESLSVDKCLEMIYSENKYGISALEISKHHGGKIERLLNDYLSKHSKK